MKKVSVLSGTILLFGGCVLRAAQSAQQAAPTVTVGKQLTAKASAPKGGPTAKHSAEKRSIGKGSLSVKASQPSAFWVEELDVDDDGTVETNDFLFDAQRGVLYTYREDDFACADGKPASGSILMALYAKGNKAQKPVGSGWYLVNVKAGKCGASKSGMFGCRFDARGTLTECGAATVNNATGDIAIVIGK